MTAVLVGCYGNMALVDALQSMRQIARALRIFAYQENLPIMVHCIHGEPVGRALRVRPRSDRLFANRHHSTAEAGFGVLGCHWTRYTHPARAAGKDRTGLIIALLLLTLGVPEEVVVLDYAKSEVELKVRQAPHLILHQRARLRRR